MLLKRGNKAGPEDLINLVASAAFWDRFREVMVSRMLPYVREIATGAAKYNVKLGLPVDMDKINEQVLAYSRGYVNDWYASLEQTTRTGLQEAITTWQQTGLGKRGLPDLVDSIEPLFGKARAQTIAETEVTRIFDEGNRLAHLSAGIEKEQWQTANDDTVCPICVPLDGKIFGINEGPRPVTDTHVRCRCARLPIVDGKALG